MHQLVCGTWVAVIIWGALREWTLKREGSGRQLSPPSLPSSSMPWLYYNTNRDFWKLKTALEQWALLGSPGSSVVGMGRISSVDVLIWKHALLFPWQKSTSCCDRRQFPFGCPWNITWVMYLFGGRKKSVAMLYNVVLKLGMSTVNRNIQNILLKLNPQNDNMIISINYN